MNPIGVNAWVWVSPPTNESIAELAPSVKAMGFDLFELGLENPGDWDPQRMADVFAANDLSAAVCAAMGPGRDLTDPDAVDATRDYLRTCIDAAAALASSRRATARRRKGDITERIIDYLKDHPQSTAGDVAKGLNANRNTIATRLSRMAKEGEVTKAARGYAAK